MGTCNALKKESGGRLLLQYTLLFALFTAGLFGVLIITHRSFMQFHDAFRQGAFRLIEIRN